MVAVAAGTPKPATGAVVAAATLPKFNPPAVALVFGAPKDKLPLATGVLVAAAPNNPKAGLAAAVASPAPVLLENWKVGAADAKIKVLAVEFEVRWLALPVGTDVVGSVKPVAVFGVPKLNDIFAV